MFAQSSHIPASAAPRSDELAHGASFAGLYDELRRVARREVRRAGGLTLSATTLLHEAYFKIRQREQAAFPDQSSFLAYAARAMRSFVIDYARNRRAQKRGGDFEITTLPTELPEQPMQGLELERLGAAIETLTQLDPALAQLVDLRFFCGYSLIEIAALRGVSERTAQRDWDKARVLLKRVLEGHSLLPE